MGRVVRGDKETKLLVQTLPHELGKILAALSQLYRVFTGSVIAQEGIWGNPKYKSMMLAAQLT